jgi:hypothetical protein
MLSKRIELPRLSLVVVVFVKAMLTHSVCMMGPSLGLHPLGVLALGLASWIQRMACQQRLHFW